MPPLISQYASSNLLNIPTSDIPMSNQIFSNTFPSYTFTPNIIPTAPIYYNLSSLSQPYTNSMLPGLFYPGVGLSSLTNETALPVSSLTNVPKNTHSDLAVPLDSKIFNISPYESQVIVI